MAQNTNSQHSAVQSNSDSFLELSKRINSIRFLLIVLVVFIHSDPIAADGIYHGANMSAVAKFIIISIYDIIARLAVPLFFLISGYLLYTKETEFIPVLKKKSRALLLPYLIWNSLEILMHFTGQSIGVLKPYFNQYIIRDFGLTDWVSAFIGGTISNNTAYHTPVVMPIAAAFWFIRDLFTFSLLFLVIKKAIDKFPFCTIITMFILWISCINIYIVSAEALLFFSLGYYVVKYSLDYKKLDAIKNSDISILYIITIIIENFWIDKVPIIHNINIIIGMIAFIKLSKYLVRKPNLYSRLLKLNAYAFFVFALHTIVVTIVKKIEFKILPTNDHWLILHFFIMAILGVTVSLTVAMLLKKYLPKVYAVLTGGRSYS